MHNEAEEYKVTANMEMWLRVLREKERQAKMQALLHLEEDLAADGKLFTFQLVRDGAFVEIMDVPSGNKMLVNVNGDNVPAMLYDVLRQGKDWLF